LALETASTKDSPRENPVESTRETRGYLLAASAACLWGLSGVISKHLFNTEVRPIDLLSLRTLIATVLLVSIAGITNPRMLRIRARDLPYFALLGLLGLACNQYLYYIALDLTSVAFALLLQYTAPLFLLVYGVLSHTETVSPGKLLAALTAVSGCALMVAGQVGGIGHTSLPGILTALGSAVCFAFYTRYGQIGLRKYGTTTVLVYAFVFSSLAWLIIRPVWILPLKVYSRESWLFVLYLASFATIIPFAFYLASLKYLEASRTNITSTLEPVVASTIAWIWLGEHMTTWQLAGGVAVLAGVVLLQVERKYR